MPSCGSKQSSFLINFYYCDTLIEPYCNGARLRPVHHPDAVISKELDTNEALAICHGAFAHGRFHRDLNLPKEAANLRYDKWLRRKLPPLRDKQEVELSGRILPGGSHEEIEIYGKPNCWDIEGSR